MKRLGYLVPVALLFFAATTSLYADSTGGCVNSPENPTAVLAIVSAASFGISQMWIRFRARKK